MGLGFSDGFKPPEGFWEHYCRVEKDVIGTEIGHECNWCGMTEEKNKLLDNS